MVGGLFVFSIVFLSVGSAADGPMAKSLLVLAVGTIGSLIAAISALVRHRTPRALEPAADGSVIIWSPAGLSAGLLVAWAALLAVCVLWGWIAATDFSQIQSPGFTLLTLVGALATLPDLVRLFTGRLHRWRLDLAPEGMTYRGFRTSRQIPWHGVSAVGIQRRGPAGVRVETREGDLVLPAAVFTLPASQLVDEIQARARCRRR